MSEQLAAVLPGIRATVLYAACAMPLTMEQYTGNTDGAIIGWAFDVDHPAESRFAKIAQSVRTPWPHVQQAEQWSFSPSGLLVSIITASWQQMPH